METVTELVYQTEQAEPTLSLEQRQVDHHNYIKIIRSVGPGSAVDILPSVMEHILSTTKKVERLELLQELARKLKDPGIMYQLESSHLIGEILNTLLVLFGSDGSESVQFELMSIICNLSQSHLTEKLLSRLHGAALSSSPLIRRQSLLLVLRALPPDTSLKFLLAYLDDDDPRVRRTAVQHLVEAGSSSSLSIPLSIYHKAINLLDDTSEEVRLHSVRLVPLMVRRYGKERITGAAGRFLALPHHAFVQLCTLMRDVSTPVRVEVARTLGEFRDIDPEYLKQTLNKKVMQSMRIGAQEFSSGRTWGGDAPSRTNAGDVNLIPPAACGAFVHGMEDEFHVVRRATVESMCSLSVGCVQYALACIPHLVDMLNDEDQDVRLLTITSLQSVSERVNLREDQLDTVTSVLEESNVEIRHSLHDLLASCKLSSQVAVRKVMKDLLENLKKYPQDKNSVFKCVRGLGSTNANYVALLAPEMLSKHPYLAQTEPSTDDVAYIATMIMVFNAAKHKSVILSFFHEYTPKHYSYIYCLLPDLVPLLPQVYKVLDSPDLYSDVTPFIATLNNLVQEFFRLSRNGDFAVAARIPEEIAKIAACSPRLRSQSLFASRLVDIFLSTVQLAQIAGGTAKKRLANGQSRTDRKVGEFIRKVVEFGHIFDNEPLTNLIKYYALRFLHRRVPCAGVTEREMELVASRLKTPPPASIPGWVGRSSLVTPHLTHRSATILSPQTNTDRILKFPAHLSHALTVEAETTRCEPARLAVRVRYPGCLDQVCQPVTDCHLRDYYQARVFLSGSAAWSEPGHVRMEVVSECRLEEWEEGLRRLVGGDTVWVALTEEPVELKIHPSLPR